MVPVAPPAPDLDPAQDAGARADLEAWRAAYAARLAAPDGWWALAALVWLDDGPTAVGASADAGVPLPAGAPERAATLERAGDRVVVVPAAPLWCDGAPVSEPVVVEATDRVFALGPDATDARFAVLVRGTRRGVRVYDPAQAARRDPGREVAWFPPEPGWRVPARFEPAADGETVAIVNVLGDVAEVPAAGRLRFELGGRPHALLATWSGERLFVNFRDATNGHVTYGAGRFLTVDAPANGATVLDFHRAHHPPCAHTPYATCPLPPLENRLTVAVAAGERHA